MAGAGGAVQDWMGWNSPLSTTPWPQVVFFSYYLTDTTTENGCLRVAPRPGSSGMRGFATRSPAWGLPTPPWSTRRALGVRLDCAV